eukprot:CAMPEP_0206318572 /NCGR_PEP_ID=MMETSP0106_2-20121207/17265_1 /ASSEMBLY_ACC=CAM_ASM_000206 /TAXON_ID=81532 /ORGANISM="Acanthoeca-like sp., Strain 10tr" /LENGTH=36 /DNA_ID= /DNA_START= /DNA_END= /DNA_ORIENTATION=
MSPDPKACEHCVSRAPAMPPRKATPELLVHIMATTA